MDAKTLFQGFSIEPVEPFEVSGLCLHSQHLKAGEAFFAFPGTHQDGRHFLSDVLSKRPSALVVEAHELENFPLPKTDIPIVRVLELHKNLGFIASRFYQEPSSKMHIIGVTGTSGKTTTSYLIYQAFQSLGIKSGYIGTLGVAFDTVETEPTLTTPDAITLQKVLRKMVDVGVEVLAMEVSSHALSQHRTNGIQFDQAVFTNLTPEHLDYHQDMESYGKAKEILFRKPELKVVTLNAEDAYCLNLASRLDPKLPMVLTSTQPITSAHVQHKLKVIPKDYQLTSAGIDAKLLTPWGEGELHSKLIGKFNLINLLMVVSVLCQYGVELKEVLHAAQKLQPVKGRMERLGGANFPQIIIDFAHKPDALRSALEAARSICKHRLWVVFGCGGNRDTLKRKEMGKIASQLADKVVITNDNPRDESPKAIIQDILMGIDAHDGNKVVVEEDRKSAISYAINHALCHDVILVAGKGHESYQIIGSQKIPYSDSGWVKQVLSEFSA